MTLPKQMPYYLTVDPLDTLLIQAWNRVSKKVREDRMGGLALKRSRRRFTGIGTRPMREWCLVIRASDTRIGPMKAIIEVDPEEFIPDHIENVAAWAIRAGVPHTVALDGRLIREMTKPVMIPWPGVTYEAAAAICGREYRSFKSWVRKCPFRIDHYREHGFPDDMSAPPRGRRKLRGDSGGRDSGGRGRGRRPYVWTASPIDANNSTGRVPHPVWGTLWQSQWKKLPEDYQLLVQRVPVFKKSGRGKARDQQVIRGWNWVCPGRLRAGGFTTENSGGTEDTEERKRSEVRDQTSDEPDRSETHPLWSALQAQRESGEYIPCGQRCKYLYGPQTVWTLPMALTGIVDGPGNPEVGFDMPEDSGLAGQWFPGMSDTIAAAGPRVFACKRCWAVRSACFANETGWNEFISTITGGLLYGHEVERPLDVCPVVRKMPVYERPPRRRLRTAEPATIKVSGA